MTGYGWGEAVQNGFKVTVELSSVNRKQSEISVNLPRELEVLEAQLRDEVNRRIARGRVTARVTLHTAAGLAEPELTGTWFREGFIGTMAELLCAIEQSRDPLNSARANLRSLALSHAAVQSADRGEPVAVE